MIASLTVDGKTTMLTPKEAKLALQAVKGYREMLKVKSYSKLEEFDLEVAYLSGIGCSDKEIARELHVTPLRVRNAIGRVESGRYGRVL